MREENIQIHAASHCTDQGDLETTDWSWTLEIDGHRDADQRICSEKAADFFERIKPYLPLDYESRIKEPIHGPGTERSFQIGISETSDHLEVIKILKEYFPRRFN